MNTGGSFRVHIDRVPQSLSAQYQLTENHTIRLLYRHSDRCHLGAGPQKLVPRELTSTSACYVSGYPASAFDAREAIVVKIVNSIESSIILVLRVRQISTEGEKPSSRVSMLVVLVACTQIPFPRYMR